MLTREQIEDMTDDVCNRPEVSEENRTVIRRLVEEHAGLKRQLERALRGEGR